jgi:hypothetical protein
VAHRVQRLPAPRLEIPGPRLQEQPLEGGKNIPFRSSHGPFAPSSPVNISTNASTEVVMLLVLTSDNDAHKAGGVQPWQPYLHLFLHRSRSVAYDNLLARR